MKIFKKNNQVRKDADNESTVALVQTKKKHKKRNAIIIGVCAILLLGAGAMIWRTPSFSGNSEAIKKAAKEMDKSNYTEAIGILSKEISVKKDDPDLYRNRAIAYLTRAEKEDKVFKNGDLSNAEKDAKKAVKLGDSTAHAIVVKLRLISRGKSKSSDAKEDEKTAARNAYADYCSQVDILTTLQAGVGAIDTNNDDVPEYLMMYSIPGVLHIVSYRENKLWEMPLSEDNKKSNNNVITNLHVSKDNQKMILETSTFGVDSSGIDKTFYNLDSYSFDVKTGFKITDEKLFAHPMMEGEENDDDSDVLAYLEERLGKDYYSLGPDKSDSTREYTSTTYQFDGYGDPNAETTALIDPIDNYETCLKGYGINLDNGRKKCDDWKGAYIDYFSADGIRPLDDSVRISIQDLNNDGIPEILIKDAGHANVEKCCYVYTFGNHQVQEFKMYTGENESDDAVLKNKDNTITLKGFTYMNDVDSFPKTEYKIAITQSGFLIKDMAMAPVFRNDDETSGKINWKDASAADITAKMEKMNQGGTGIKWSKRIDNKKEVFKYIKNHI